MYKKKLFLIVLILMISTVLGACAPEGPANGQNYYCPDEGFFDIIQTEPELQVRFTCTKEREFEVVFGGPNDTKLVERLRKYNRHTSTGVVLQDGQIIQIYKISMGDEISIMWPIDDD